MHGVHFEYGGYQKEQHPLVVDVLEIDEIVAPKVLHELIGGVDHQHSREDEEDVGEGHDFLQPSYGQTCAVVGLHDLHRGKSDRPDEEYPTRDFLIP